MKLFLDTADIDAITRANDTRLLDGITTNFSKILEARKTFRKVLAEICSQTKGSMTLTRTGRRLILQVFYKISI
jgi:transaldolase